MLRTGRRRGQGGAIAAVVLAMAGMLMAAGGAALDLAALAGADERAGATADAVAHAAEVVLSQDDYLAELSVDAQANRQACLLDPAEHADASEQDACQPTLAAARAAAAANAAQLTYFRLGPSLADRLNTQGPGRLTTLVRVAVRRSLPVAAPPCPAAPPAEPSICWAVAWSAAQLT